MKFLLQNGFLKPVIFVLIISGLNACVSQRRVIKEPLKNYGTEYLIEEMKAREFKSEYFTARFSAEVVRNRDRYNFNGQLRMKKDSLIWLTFSPALGMEMGRLIITQDSVKWMNRMESNYLLAYNSQLAKMIHPLLDYDLLQSFMLGNDLTLYENTQFKGSIDNREYKLSIMQRRKLKKLMLEQDDTENIPIQHIWLDPETFRISRVAFRDLQDRDAKIDVEYQRFAEVNGFLFPTRQQYDIQASGNKLSILINFSRLDTPNEASFPFTIPEKFTPIAN